MNENGPLVIIVHDSKNDGFEIYKQASQSNDVEKTLKAVSCLTPNHL